MALSSYSTCLLLLLSWLAMLPGIAAVQRVWPQGYRVTVGSLSVFNRDSQLVGCADGRGLWYYPGDGLCPFDYALADNGFESYLAPLDTGVCAIKRSQLRCDARWSQRMPVLLSFDEPASKGDGITYQSITFRGRAGSQILDFYPDGLPNAGQAAALFLNPRQVSPLGPLTLKFRRRPTA